MSVQEKNSVLNDYQLKEKRLCAEFTITGNATPASKEHGVPDLPGVMLLRTEGKTAEVDAIETVAYTTASDDTAGDSTFGFMIRGGANGLGTVSKILNITVTETTATPTATALTLTKHGTDGLTTDGNVACSIVAAGCDLDTESPRILVTVDYVS